LYSSLSIDASLSAEYGFFSASASANIADSYSFSSDSITWIAQVKMVFGRFQPAAPSPIPSITSLSVADIQTVCGTQIVTQETRGVQASVIYHLDNLNTTQKQAIQTALSFSAGGFGGSVSGQAALDKAMSTAQQTSQLTVQVITQGGPGRSAISTIVSADSDLSQIRTALAAYISNSSEANSAPLAFETSSISQFYPQVGTPQVVTARNDAIVVLYNEYLDLNSVVNRIYSFIKVPAGPQEDFLSTFVTQQQRTQLGQLTGIYNQRMQQIKTQATSCLNNDSACNAVDVSDLQRPVYPVIPAMPTVVESTVCSVPLLGVVGQQTPDGALTGYFTYTGYLVGQKGLFQSLFATTNGIRTPIAVGPANSPQIKIAETFAKSGTFAGEKCQTFSPDTTQAFGSFVIERNLYNKQPFSLGLELDDIFNRVSTSNVTPP
jgi:hypothetical protein